MFPGIRSLVVALYLEIHRVLIKGVVYPSQSLSTKHIMSFVFLLVDNKDTTLNLLGINIIPAINIV
ncbi:conserved protein of unknown function [Xenorhabdus nematophila AN6/1]|nr:conserved hypothetical protein [Xenorhabdus nematophila str. Anatoliense]CEE95968.1 conserved hypothetical protein [Xenorhabdus nematophila str. Anatoliense]CEF30355.1 conserved hypothetical protein [Xenorhabdus nematophila str. Websteri]CEF33967.1 conserved hypothetical protein [Xenorhabdus nematophila str. Websteri]CEK23027.1 conserved protein of unknown function [Xenorhabdus nematophila AN6/1]